MGNKVLSSKPKPAGRRASDSGHPRRSSDRPSGVPASAAPSGGGRSSASRPSGAGVPANRYGDIGEGGAALADTNGLSGFQFGMRWPFGELLGLTGPGAVAPPSGAALAGDYRVHGDVKAPADANVTTGFHFGVRWPFGELIGLTGPGGILGEMGGGGSKTGTLVAKGKDPAGDPAWIEETLRVHNELRAKHGSPPLEWDSECAAAARRAAQACAQKGAMFHNNSKEYGHGQNIFMGTPVGMFGAKSAIESWYNEIDKPGYYCPAAPGTGHFTAVVWLATTHVGMNCDDLGKGFIVANYKPAGNMMPADPHYLRNVLPLGTPMQRRLKTCAERKKITTTRLTDEVQEILHSIPHENIKQKVVGHLKAGLRVDIEFKPPPKGSIKVDFHKRGGGRTSMHGTW